MASKDGKIECRIDPKIKRLLLQRLKDKGFVGSVAKADGKGESAAAGYRYVLEAYAKGQIMEVEIMDDLVEKMDKMNDRFAGLKTFLEKLTQVVEGLRKK